MGCASKVQQKKRRVLPAPRSRKKNPKKETPVPMAVRPDIQETIESHISSAENKKRYQLPVELCERRKKKMTSVPRVLVLSRYHLWLFSAEETAKKKTDHFMVHFFDLSEAIVEDGLGMFVEALCFTRTLQLLSFEHVVFTYQKRDQKAAESIAIKSESVNAATIVSTFCQVYTKCCGLRKSLNLNKEFPQSASNAPHLAGEHYLQTYKAWCSYYSVPYTRSVSTHVRQLCIAKVKCLDFSKIPGVSSDDDAWSSPIGPAISALQYDEYFTHIKLAGFAARKDTLQELAEVLKTNQTILSVDVQNIDASTHAAAFVSALQLPRYTSFQFADIVLKSPDALVKAVVNMPNLTTLGKIASKTMVELWKAFSSNIWTSNLVKLDLSGNTIDESAGKYMASWASSVESKAKLEILNLADTTLVAAKLEDFAKLVTLKEVNLRGNKFDCVAQLNGLKTFLSGLQSPLEKLNLSSCGLGNNMTGKDAALSVAAILQNPKVKSIYLDISRNEGLGPLLKQILSNADNLTALDVSHMKLKQESFLGMMEKLPWLPVKHLKMENTMESKTPALVQPLKLIANSKHLNHLSIVGSASREATLALLQALSPNLRIQSLDISNCGLVSNDSVVITSFLMSQKSLKYFAFDSSSFGAEAWNAIRISLNMNSSIEELAWPIKDLNAFIADPQNDPISKEQFFSTLNQIQAMLKERKQAVRHSFGFTFLSDTKLNNVPEAKNNEKGKVKTKEKTNDNEPPSFVVTPGCALVHGVQVSTGKEMTPSPLSSEVTGNGCTVFDPFVSLGSRMLPHEGIVFALSSGSLAYFT